VPIYEFYCPACHTIYSFFSRRIATDKTPACPGCKQTSLQRQISRFAVTRGGRIGEESGDSLENLPIDESKMEQAMASLASESEGMNEEDPRAAAQLMRKLSDMTGLKYTGNMEEALGRLEAGEDPETIEAEMGEILEGDEMPFIVPGARTGGRVKPPKRDETLYELE
jgi:putative FmdB family regulatory protein